MPSTGWVVQILLPLYDNEGARFGEDVYARTRTELLDAFGGLTAYQRSPARGLWKSDDGEVARDDVVIFEVMTPDLDRSWWHRYRIELEHRFKQETILTRALQHELL